VLTFWLLFRGEPSARRDVLAGACLAFSTIKPQMQFLIIPLLILWALKARRWHFIVSAALSMLVLIGVSFLMLPTWLSEWFGQVFSYASYTPVLPPLINILLANFIKLCPCPAWRLQLLLYGGLLVEWRLLSRNSDERRISQ